MYDDVDFHLEYTKICLKQLISVFDSNYYIVWPNFVFYFGIQMNDSVHSGLLALFSGCCGNRFSFIFFCTFWTFRKVLAVLVSRKIHWVFKNPREITKKDTKDQIRNVLKIKKGKGNSNTREKIHRLSQESTAYYY